MARVLLILQYAWASPNTLFGLVLAILCRPGGGELRVVSGVIEAHGPWLCFLLTRLVPLRGGALAITLGHVVVGQHAEALAATRDHERVHVRQYARWGPLFLPAYVIASAVALITGRRPYRDNRFEREAYGDED